MRRGSEFPAPVSLFKPEIRLVNNHRQNPDRRPGDRTAGDCWPELLQNAGIPRHLLMNEVPYGLTIG